MIEECTIDMDQLECENFIFHFKHPFIVHCTETEDEYQLYNQKMKIKVTASTFQNALYEFGKAFEDFQNETMLDNESEFYDYFKNLIKMVEERIES